MNRFDISAEASSRPAEVNSSFDVHDPAGLSRADGVGGSGVAADLNRLQIARLVGHGYRLRARYLADAGAGLRGRRHRSRADVAADLPVT